MTHFTVALIHRIWQICLLMAQSAEIAPLLGLQLDAAAQQSRFHVVLSRMQFHFVTTPKIPLTFTDIRLSQL
jgi:hypothetical protein